MRAAISYLLRRFRLLPGGVPDRLGEDRRLGSVRLRHEVMVFFADTIGSLYQIEQWYEAFAALNEQHRLIVVAADSRTAARVRADSGLDVIVVGRDETLTSLVERSRLRVALYVNHNPENFANLRFDSMVHASLMHGDSDKGVTVSNQTKAYDYSLVAGRAAVDRMAAFSTFYDAEARCIPIGRPQVDNHLALSDGRAAEFGKTVLYAPTWEGPQPSAAYGTIGSHGLQIVRQFVSSGWRVLYRPHPLSGIRSPDYGDADRTIRSFIDQEQAQSGVSHRLAIGQDLSESFAEADLLICDISGVAMDWLPTGKPLIVTRPAGESVSVAASALTELVPALPVGRLPDLIEIAEEETNLDPQGEQRRGLIEYYMGELTPGAAKARFVEVVSEMTVAHPAS